LGDFHEAGRTRPQACSFSSHESSHRQPEPRDADGLAPPHWPLARARVSAIGITVGLYWHPDGDEISVQVSDELTGENFVVEPPKNAALAAFYHPYGFRSQEGCCVMHASQTGSASRTWTPRPRPDQS
jgi:hypothetical protein